MTKEEWHTLTQEEKLKGRRTTKPPTVAAMDKQAGANTEHSWRAEDRNWSRQEEEQYNEYIKAGN